MLSNETIERAVRMAQYAKPEQALKILQEALGTEAEEVEGIQDIVGAMFEGNTETGIAITYDDAAGKINAAVDSDIITKVGFISVTQPVDLDTIETSGLLTGAGNPGSGLGVDGNHYRNTSDNTFWYKVSGGWVEISDFDTYDGGYF